MRIWQKILNKIDWIYNTYKSKQVLSMPHIEVLDFDKSIDALLDSKASLARFGDGEFSLMLNGEFLRRRNISLRFQDADPKLKLRLKEVLSDPDTERYNLKIAISSGIVRNSLLTFTDEAYHFWQNFLVENRYKIYQLLTKDYPYIDTLISRFYMDYRDKNEGLITDKVNKLKKIWNNQDLLIVEGAGSRLGLNNDLFDNVKSIIRIACPNVNAFSKYDEILIATKEFAKDRLVILALGPTATVLAYDLAKSGFRALDLGYIDVEYEWFLMKAETKSPIKGKIMTEIDSESNHEGSVLNIDSIYKKQVLKIL